MNLQDRRLLATALVGLGVATPPPLAPGPHTGKPAVEAARADARSGDDWGAPDWPTRSVPPNLRGSGLISVHARKPPMRPQLSDASPNDRRRSVGQGTRRDPGRGLAGTSTWDRHGWDAAMKGGWFSRSRTAVPMCFRRACASAALVAIVLMSMLTPDARAVATGWVGDRHAAVRLITGEQATGTMSTVDAGLQIRLAPGWHAYWRTPGAAGIPASITWIGSRNLRSATLSWPAPRRFPLEGLQTYGYETGVVLPIALRLADPGAPLILRADVNYSACKTICVPYHATLDLTLPTGLALPGPEAALITAARARIPGSLVQLGLILRAVEVARAAGGRSTLILRLATGGRPLVHPDLFVEGLPQGAPGRPHLTLSGSGATVILVVPRVHDAASVLAGRRLAFTLTEGLRGAATFHAAPRLVSVDALPGRTRLPLAILAVALLGGLILNVMPCVLPVLSLKLFALADLAGAERRRVRIDLLVTAAGILAGFVALAGGLIALKEAGAAIGWGIQFQLPWYLAAMTMVMVLFAAGLWGWIGIGLPGGVASRLGTAQLRSRRGTAFLTGLFATLLAASCSAPFVGTAVGFALARGPIAIMGIFLAMGLGLAAPYLLGATVPRLVSLLPRPGRWMLGLRFAFGLLLLGTALWLLSVLIRVGGGTQALLAGGFAAGLLGILAARRYAGLARRLTGGLAGALVVGAVGVAAVLPRAPEAAAMPLATRAAGPWRPFDRTAIAAEVARGRVVFVDVTAAWCLVCKVNELTVLDRDPVAARLRAPGVVAMRADWTRPSPAITAYLQSFGRYGVPLDVVYGPGAPQGVKLPDLLTADAVMRAFAAAAGAPRAAASGRDR